MKKLLLISVSFLFFCCSSDDGGNSVPTQGQSLSFDGRQYGFDTLYAVKVPGGYSLMLSKGEVVVEDGVAVEYSADFKRAITMSIVGSAVYGQKNFKVLQHPTGLENRIAFRDSYQISGGQPSSFETIFVYSDNISAQSRVIITEFEDGNYSLDFNVLTTAGVISGNYHGKMTKIGF